jgi:hypothetical protein
MTAGHPGSSPPRARDTLFRIEAVTHHAKGRTSGRVLDLKDRTAAWAFGAMVVTLALVTTLGLLVGVDESATGQAVVPATGTEAIVLLPIGTSPRLHPGLAVELGAGHRRVRTTLVSVGRTLSTADAMRRYGVRFAPSMGPAVVLTRVALPAASSRPAAGTGVAVVVLARRSLAAVLVSRG